MALLQPYSFGSGLLWVVQLTDVTGTAITYPTPQRLGVMQEMQVKLNGPMKDLFGQYSYPVASGRGEIKATATAKFASINMGLFNSLFFGEPSSPAKGGATQVMIINDETAAIPTTPYEITVAGSADFTQDLGVKFTNGALAGQQLIAVTGTPTTGQYSVTAGVYTFAAADNVSGYSVAIDYVKATTSSSNYSIQIVNRLMGSAPQFMAFGKAVFANTAQKMGFRFNVCISDTWGFPTKVDDFAVMDTSFSMYADGSNDIGVITGTAF